MADFIKGLSRGIWLCACAVTFLVASGATQLSAQSDNWVGFMTAGPTTDFIRVGPQVLAGPEAFFHRPDAWEFNRNLLDFAADEAGISFEVGGETPLTFRGELDGEHYAGSIRTSSETGTFILHPSARPPSVARMVSYAGTYEIGVGAFRTVGFEDLAGMTDPRLFYSDDDNVVLMYPLSETTFLTSHGEYISFSGEDGAVSGMIIRNGPERSHAPRVQLARHEDVSFENADATFAGTLMIPDTPAPHPAVIIAHSSALGERHAYWMFASQLVQDGVAVLVYDRRGHGQSSGGGPLI